MACFCQPVGADSDGSGQEPCQKGQMACSGKDIFSSGSPGRQCGLLGGNVSFPPQNPTLVFCGGHATDPDRTDFDLLLAENPGSVKFLQSERAFLALGRGMCYTGKNCTVV